MDRVPLRASSCGGNPAQAGGAQNANVQITTADPLVMAERHGARIRHVHCKDVRGAMLERAIGEDRGFTDSVLDGVFTVPGDGSLDFAELLSALDDQGYDGWLVVEADQDPAKAHPLTFARRGYDTLAAASAARFKS